VAVATDGPSGEYGPVVVELPLGDLTVVAADGEGWTCTRSSDDSDNSDNSDSSDDSSDVGTGAALRCEHGRRGVARSDALLGPGDSLPPIRMTLVADTDGDLVQTVRARGVTDDEVRTATLAVEVERRLGLSLVVEAPALAAVTDEAELRWSVANDGPSATNSGLTVTGVLPTGWTYLGADAPGWACESSLVEVTCHTDEVLASGANDTLTLAMAVGPDARIGATPLTATLQLDSIDAAVDATSGDDSTEVEVWVSSAPSTAAVEAAPPSVGTASVPAQENDESSARDPATVAPTADGAGSVATLAGYGGAVGAFAFAVVLISGRRRRHW